MENQIYTPSSPDGSLRQGEILSNLIQLKLLLESIDTPRSQFQSHVHPFAIVVSQDCDLDWDFDGRRNGSGKLIPNVLLCEVDTAVGLRNQAGVNSGIWKNIEQNKNERYHFLQAIKPKEDALGVGIDELAIDFKRYFTLPTDELYVRLQRGETQRRCRLVSPYLEHFSTRFGYFQFRIALPENHFSV